MPPKEICLKKLQGQPKKAQSRFRSSLAAVMLLLTLPDASAVSFGEMRSSPRFGELLHAEIDVEEDPADRVDASCLKLYRPTQVNGDLPWITEARLSFRHESGKAKLYISSDRPLRDPVVQIGVQSTCPGGRVWRDYTLLVVVPAALAGRESAPAPAATRLARAVVPARKIDRVLLSAHSEPAERLDAEIARPARKSRGIATSGIPAADRELTLRMASELGSPDSPSEAERDLLRVEYRMLAALHEQAGRQLDLAEELRRLERTTNDLKVAGERLGVNAAVAPIPASTAAPANEVAPPAQAMSSLAPESAVSRVIPQARPEARPQAETDDLIGWPFYAGLGMLALFVLLFVIRRRRSAAMDAHFLPMHAPTIIVDEPGFSRPPESAAAVPLEVPDQPVESEASVPVMAVTQDIPPPPEKLEVSPVMELAEIMLSFGRVQGAAQTLQEYIQANPKEALQPWIRLLEIYRDNDMRTEFEALAANLNQNFNVEIVNWDSAVPGERVEMTLELLPHIRDQIDALWGSPECLEYLQKLLHDNRDGQRSGFALPVVREILLLIDLMVAEKAAA